MEVYRAPEMLLIGSWLHLLCVFIRNQLQHASVVQGDVETAKLLEHSLALIGLMDKVPEIKAGTNNNYKNTSTPAYLPDPLSDFLRVWFRH